LCNTKNVNGEKDDDGRKYAKKFGLKLNPKKRLSADLARRHRLRSVDIEGV